MSAVLKPCPFCGGNAKVRAYRLCEDAVQTYVECTLCSARTDGIEAAYSNGEYARAEWNQRATPAAATEGSKATPAIVHAPADAVGDEEVTRAIRSFYLSPASQGLHPSLLEDRVVRQQMRSVLEDFASRRLTAGGESDGGGDLATLGGEFYAVQWVGGGAVRPALRDRLFTSREAAERWMADHSDPAFDRVVRLTPAGRPLSLSERQAAFQAGFLAGAIQYDRHPVSHHIAPDREDCDTCTEYKAAALKSPYFPPAEPSEASEATSPEHERFGKVAITPCSPREAGGRNDG